MSRHFWAGETATGILGGGRFGLTQPPSLISENGGLPRFLLHRDLLSPDAHPREGKRQQLRQFRRALSQAVAYHNYEPRGLPTGAFELAALEMLRKIVERGPLCPPHPAVEQLIRDAYQPDILRDAKCETGEQAEQLPLKILARLVHGWARDQKPLPCPQVIQCFEDERDSGSRLERKRWEECQSANDGGFRRWTHPQLFVRDLVSRTNDDSDGRRIDFVICPPWRREITAWECHGDFSLRDEAKQKEIQNTARDHGVSLVTEDEIAGRQAPSIRLESADPETVISSASFALAVDAAWVAHQIDHALLTLIVDGVLSAAPVVQIYVPSAHRLVAEEATRQFVRLLRSVERMWPSSSGPLVAPGCEFFVNPESSRKGIRVDIDPSKHTYLAPSELADFAIVVRRACLPFDGPPRMEQFPFPAVLRTAQAMARIEEVDLLPLLERVFGLSAFREQQVEAIRRATQSDDSLVLLPTGYGKSLIFYMAAFIRPGTAIVVEGWKSLLDDQERKLNEFGIERVVKIHGDARSTRPLSEMVIALVAPERLYLSGFDNATQDLARNGALSLLVVDEAHAVAIAGHDFRPAYLGVRHRVKSFSERSGQTAIPVLALTATASETVVREIRTALEISAEPISLVSGFARAELHDQFRRASVESGEPAMRQALNEVLSDNRTMGRGIVYCSSAGDWAPLRRSFRGETRSRWYGVNGAADLIEGLIRERADRPRRVCRYMGSEKMSGGDQKDQVRSFIAETDSIMVATDAFGAGIDIPDVRWVAQIGLPSGMEQFAQQMGRAGRDGRTGQGFVLHDDPVADALEDVQRRLRACLQDKDPVSAIQRLVSATDSDQQGSIYRHLFMLFGRTTPIVGGLDFSKPPATKKGQSTRQKSAKFSGNALDEAGGNWVIDKLDGKSGSCTISYDSYWEIVIAKAILRLCWLGVLSPSYTTSGAKSGLKSVVVEVITPIDRLDRSVVAAIARARAARYLNPDFQAIANGWLEQMLASAASGSATCKIASNYLGRAINRAVAITRVQSLITLLEYALEPNQNRRRQALDGYFTDDTFTKLIREISGGPASQGSWRRAAEELSRDPVRFSSLRRLQEDPISAPLATYLLVRAMASDRRTSDASRELAALIGTFGVDGPMEAYVWKALKSDYPAAWDEIVSRAIVEDQSRKVAEFASRQLSDDEGTTMSANAVVATAFAGAFRSRS